MTDVMNAIATPTPAQQELYEWSLAMDPRDPRVCLNVGDAGSGKTDSACIAILMNARWRQVYNNEKNLQYILLGATIKTVERNMKKFMMNAAELLELPLEHRQGKFVMGDCEFICFGLDNTLSEARLRGVDAAGMLVDEVVKIRYQNDFQYALGRVRNGERHHQRIIVTTNPDNPAHWFKIGWWDKEGGKRCIRIFHNVRDNPSMSEEEIEEQMMLMDGAQRKRMYEGIWAATEGMVWPHTRVVEGNDNITYKRIEAGVDGGWKHASAAIFIGITKDNEWHVIGEYYKKSTDTTLDGHANAMYKTGLALAKRYKLDKVARWHFGADTLTLALMNEMRKGRESRRPVATRKARTEVDPGLEAVGQAFRLQRLVIINGAAPNLQREVGGYVWDPRENMDKPLKENDDACDALRYAVMGLKRPGALRIARAA